MGVAGQDTSSATRPMSLVPPASTEVDGFQSGQWWKNRALSASTALSGCRCGSCSNCAAQAYSSQSQTAALGSPLPGQEDGENVSGKTMGPASQLVEAEEQASGEKANASTLSQVKGADGEPLTREEVSLLLELKKADAAVRAHEQAHLAAAGGLAKGGASFSYRRGPDGRNYAVGGEVQIDTSKGSTPEKTLAKMMQVRAAALAPANPSPQDRKVAAAASSAMTEARQELNLEKVEERGRQREAEQSGAESGEGEAVSGNGFSVGEENAQGPMVSRAASLYKETGSGGGRGRFHFSV